MSPGLNPQNAISEIDTFGLLYATSRTMRETRC